MYSVNNDNFSSRKLKTSAIGLVRRMPVTAHSAQLELKCRLLKVSALQTHNKEVMASESVAETKIKDLSEVFGILFLEKKARQVKQEVLPLKMKSSIFIFQ